MYIHSQKILTAKINTIIRITTSPLIKNESKVEEREIMWSRYGRKMRTTATLQKTKGGFFVKIDEILETRALRAAFVFSYLLAARASRAPIALLHLLKSLFAIKRVAHATRAPIVPFHLLTPSLHRLGVAHATLALIAQFQSQ